MGTCTGVSSKWLYFFGFQALEKFLIQHDYRSINMKNWYFMIHICSHVFNRIFQSPFYIQPMAFPSLCAILYKCHFHSLLINCRRQLYFYSRLVWLIGKLHFGSKYDLRAKNSLLPYNTHFLYIFFLSSRVVQYCNIWLPAFYHTITYLINVILIIDFLFLRWQGRIKNPTLHFISYHYLYSVYYNAFKLLSPRQKV